MADNTQKVSIKIDVSGEHIKQLKALADNVSKVTTKVKELQTAIDAMGGGTGKTTFSSSHLVSALGEVKTAIAAIKDTGFDKVSKALDSLDAQKLNNFSAAVERLKAGLDPSLIQNTSAFADAIKRMGEAQSKFSGAETARQVNDLLGGLQKMENINTANFRNISSALSELNLGANLTSIEAISRLGYALRSIKDFGEGKNPLTNLADGMRSLIGLKQSDTFLYRVRQITLAASLLARSEPVDFSKFTKALQELGQFDYNSVKWENIKQINAGIKGAFEDLRTVKVPNIKGLMQGLDMVDETYKNLKPENLSHIATTLVNEFGKLSQLKMPQLGSLTKNLKLLSSGEYDFNKVAENVNTFKKSLMDLNGIKLPNIGNFFRGFEVLQNVSFKGMEAKVKSLVERINQLKTSASLDGWDNIKVPNLHSFIKGIHDLGSIRLDEQHLQNINHNIRSIPNKLREIAGIQAPDLSKFATGLLDLGRSTVNAQKVSNIIGNSLNAITENLPKHELKLPNLSGLTKGIRDFQLLQEAGKADENSIKSIVDTISSLTTPLKRLDKVSLPNVQGIATAIHKLSTAVPENAGTTASVHISAIVDAVKKLDGVKTPDLTKISNAFKTLNEAVLVEQSSLETKKPTTRIQENINALKTAVDSLKELPSSTSGRLPNLKNITDAFKVLNDTTLKTEEVFRNGKMGIGSESVFRLRNNLDIIKQAIGELQALNVNAPKMPDLKSIVSAFKDLNSPLMKLEESWKLGKGGLQSESIYRFHNNMNAIKEAISSLQALGGDTPKIPSLKGVMAAFKELNETILKGYSSLSEGGPKNVRYIYENIDAIKAIYTALQSVGTKEAPKIPSLKGVMAAFRELNDTSLKGKGTDDYGNQYSNILTNLNHLVMVITTLQSLGKKADSALPSLSSITTFFKTFNEKVRKEGFFDGKGNWTGQVTTRVQQNAEYLKDALLKLAEVGKVNIPNLSSVTTAFKVFNESTLKGAFTDNYGNQYSNMLDNLAAIKHVIKELQSLGGKNANKIPNLKNITDAFKVLNDTTLKTEEVFRHGKMGIGSESIFQFRNNLDIIKQAITELQNLNRDAPKMPNLKGIVDAFKDLNSPLMKLEESFRLGKSGLQSESIYRFHNNMELIKQAIKDLQALGSKDANKIPNLNGVLDAFKVLNENSLKGFSTWSADGSTPRTIHYFHENIAAIKQAISDLQSLGGKEANKIPNLKSIVDAFKTLNNSFSKGVTDDYGNLIKSNLTQNIEAISDAIKKLQGLGGKTASKIPNLKNVADAFKILDEAIPKGKTAFDVHRFEGRIQQIKTAISNLQSLGGKEANKIPNLKSIADAFTALDAIPKNVRVGWTDRFRLNIDQAIEAIEDLQRLGGKGANKIPNLKSVADAFVALDRIPVPKDNKFTTGHFEENLSKVEDAIKRLQALGGKEANKIPNIKPVADAFKILNDSALWGFNTWKKGASSGDFVSHIDRNLNEITKVITSLQKLNKAVEGGKSPTMPNLKNIADAFKILNESPIKNNPLRNADGSWNEASLRVSNIRRNLDAIKTALDEVRLDTVKVPNLKNIADAFKILNETPMTFKAGYDTDLSWGIPTIKANLKKLKEAFTENDLSAIKVPNLKNVSDAFKTLNSIEKLETVPDAQGTPTRVKHYVDEIAKAFQSANETLKDVKLPNIKNVADAFRILNSIEVKDDKNNNFVRNLNRVWEQLRAFKRDTELQDIKFPNIKNVAEAFKILDIVPKSDKVITGKFSENFNVIKDAITQLKDFDKVRLPNVKNIADAFRIFNESVLREFSIISTKKTVLSVDENVKVIKDALTQLKEAEVIKLPNLKNIADAFTILNKIPKDTDNTNIGAHFKANIAAIASALSEHSEQLSKIRLPNLKNLADAYNSLNTFKPKDLDTLAFRNNIKEIRDALKSFNELYTQTNQGKPITLPNLDGLAKGFKTLNEISLQHGNKKGSVHINNMRRNINAIITALQGFEGKNFDIPNIKNLGDGLKRLNDIATVNQQLPQNMETLKRGLEVINGFRAPQLKNFADGLHSLDSFSKKSTGELITPKLATDLSNLATALEKFTGVQLPSNLAGFAKGVEAINKVNIEHFSKKFLDLIKTMHTLNLNVPQTAIDALTAKLVVCEHAIRTVEGRLNNTTSVFARFGKGVQDTDVPLTKFQERVKTFLQYRVISNVFNRITNWIQSIPENIKEFEKAMYNVQSITGATDMTIAKLGVTVKEIASTTKFSAQEVADGMTMIAQAGFTAGQSMQMMQSISDLATGTLTDMRTVVDLVTSAMVVFGIESNNSARVSDVFANAVNKSKLTMDKIRTAFNYIGPVAKDANISFEESTVAMMLLANSGQKASTIGTGLRNVLSTILSPSKKLAEAAATVGVSLTDLDPRVNSFRDVLSNLGVVVRDSQVALDVFGKRGATAVLSLTNGIKDYDRLYSSVTRVGSAAEMAAKQQEGLYVRWKNLTDRAQLLAVTLGENGLTAILSGFVDVLSGAINFINSLNESLFGKFTIRLVALVAAVGSLTVAFKALWAMKAIGGVMFSPLTAAVSYLATLFPTFTKRIGSLKQNLSDLKYTTTTAAKDFEALRRTYVQAPRFIQPVNTGLIHTAMSLREVNAVVPGVTRLGIALRALGSIAGTLFTAFLPLMALMAFDYFTVTAEKLEHNLQKISEQLDKINNQSKSVTDTLDKITKLQAGTEEYANAIKSILTAIEDNNGAIIGAEGEFMALLASVNETNDAFTDGGAALRMYGQRLKELSVIQASSALQTAGDIFNRNMRSYSFGFFGGHLTTKAKFDYNLSKERTDESGKSPYWRDINYSTADKIFRDIATGVKKIEDVFDSKKSYTVALDAFNELNERAAAFVNSLIAVGDISVYSSIDQVSRLAHGLGATGDQLDAVIDKFRILNEAAKRKLFADIVPMDVQDAVNALKRETGSTKVAMEAKGKYNFDSHLFLDENNNALTERVKEQVQAVDVDVEALQNDIQAVANELEKVSKNAAGVKFSVNAEDVQKATAVYTKIIQLSLSIEKIRKEHAKKLEEASRITNAVEREETVARLNREYKQLEDTLRAINNENLKGRNEERNVNVIVRGLKIYQEQVQRTQKMQENLNNTVAKYKELMGKEIADARAELQKKGIATLRGDTIFNKEELDAAVKKHRQIMQDTIDKMTADTNVTIASIQQSSQETLLGTIRAAIPVGTRMDEITKEEKGNKKHRDIILQSELNRIQIQEDAYKQSEGRIGLAFKEARAKEQEAHVRYMAARLADILRYEKEIKDSYRSDNEETKKALEKIQEMKKAIVEEGYRAMHDLDQKNAKAAFFLAKEQGDAIANQERKANEQRKQRQEKALHEVAALESKGVISHEKAELKKAEISVKYHDEIIKSRREQIEVLKQLGEAQNIQQIVRLEEEIEKSTYDAVKAARQGIEVQTKAVYEAERKLKELQGESFDLNPFGDFSAKQQIAITEEYKKEVEKRKKLIAEGFDSENDTIFSSTSKVAEEIRKHYDKVDSIAVKSAEKRETLEQSMLKKKEEYEKKKLDITKKYDAKILALEDERQDAMDIIDTEGNSKELQKRKAQRAEERIERASENIAAAVEEGDKQELEALFSQLQSATNILLGTKKPSQYRGDIQRAFDLRKQILEAQKKLELKEEEEKFQRELKQDKRRLEVLKSSAEQALLAENGRHKLAMYHLEQEAEKIREQIKLAKNLMSVYNEQISKGEVLKAQERTVPAGQKNAGLPTNRRGTMQEVINRAIQGDDSVKKSEHDVLKEYGLDKEQYEAMLKELEAVFKGTQKAGEQSAVNVTNAYKTTIEELKTQLADFSKEIEDSINILREKKDEYGRPLINPEIIDNLKHTLKDATRIAMNELNAINVDVEVNKDKLKDVQKNVQGMINTLNSFKAQVEVNANTDEAKQKIFGIIQDIEKIPNKITVRVAVEKTETTSAATPAEAKASGGLIFSRLQSRFINKGSGTKDDVPALLMKNEFVHRAAAVKKYGVDFMYKLNNLQIPASITKMFANGGIVGSTIGFVQKYANGGLIRSTKRKLEELFAGSGINLNVNNLDISTKLEQAANEFTSPIGIQAMGMMAKNIEEGISRFVTGGAPQDAALNAQQMQGISKAYSDSISKAQASGNATIAQALRNEREQVTTLSQELQQILVNLNKRYTEEAEQLDDEHRKKLQEKKEEYEKNVREENESYDEKVYADEKTYTKEDEEYENSKKERKENYETSIKELKDNLENERLSYEADLISKQQAVAEKEAALQDFRNQLHSDKYPVGFAGHKNASIEELIIAHAEYAKKKYGSDKRYIIDLGGLIKTADILAEKPGEKSNSYSNILLSMTEEERRVVESLVSSSMRGSSGLERPDVIYNIKKDSDYYNKAINEYLDLVKKNSDRHTYMNTMQRFSGKPQELPPEQNMSYVNYLLQHLHSDYTIPLEQARIELDKMKSEDDPELKATKKIQELTEEFNAANKKAEEERKEVLIQRKRSIDERDISHKEKLAELKKDYDEFVLQENSEYAKSSAELKENNKNDIAQMNLIHSDRLKTLRDNTAKIISSAKEAMMSSINAARKSKAESISAVKDDTTRVQSSRELNQYSLESLEDIIKKMRGAIKFATGGLVPLVKGAKAGTDSVLSLLSPNEFVMSAKAVRAFGVNFMHSLNNLKIPAFATGGIVGASTPVREGAIDKIMNKTVYALDLTLNNTHIGELTGEKNTIDSFMFAMDRARMGMI